ncbi:unnamed protein product [Phytophthora fragariaefolia]|uniref:Unnamed protein product n=1 Tax=Phytophthora fragariaefolia TaxID=1490495 RepID=A0A9W6Y1L0_9STRA|nr:unnamed protein product [Phytophthora fragariaefolia]
MGFDGSLAFRLTTVYEDVVEPSTVSSALKTVQPAMLFCSTSFRGIGVDTGMVAAFNLLKACTMRHFPVGLRTQSVRNECGDFDSRTMPAACFASKKASITSTCPFGSGHCRVGSFKMAAPYRVCLLEVRSSSNTSESMTEEELSSSEPPSGRSRTTSANSPTLRESKNST